MKTKKFNEKKGFTFMELVITMIIVITLSLISWPIYRGHVSKEYSVLAEGYALLGALKDAQISYYNEYGRFLHQWHSYAKNAGVYTGSLYTFNDPVLGINAINNRYFSSFIACGTNLYYGTDIKDTFTAVVCSKDYGTLWQVFSMTQKYDLSLINVKNVTL